MNNFDLINQMNLLNQNLANQIAIDSMTNDCINRPKTEIETIILLGFTGFLVLFAIFTLWYSLKE